MTTSIPEPIVLQIVLPDPNTGNVKRQGEVGVFLGDSGEVNQTTCGSASQFSLLEGELLVNGLAVRTSPGVAFSPFRVSVVGTISTTFAVTGGVLEWTNELFFGGRAGICQDAQGITYGTFTANYAELLECKPVEIVAVLGMFANLLVVSSTAGCALIPTT